MQEWRIGRIDGTYFMRQKWDVPATLLAQVLVDNSLVLLSGAYGVIMRIWMSEPTS